MEHFKKALEELENTKKGIDRLYFKKIEHKYFIDLFTIYANIEIKKLGKEETFLITKENKPIIDILFVYLTGEKSDLDLNKGILLVGGFGIGKTLIMKAFINLINSYQIKIITTLHSKELTIELPKKGLQDFKKKPLFIDDIGKENKEVLVYGTRIKPYVDMISLRYEFPTWNFGTSNYNMNTLKELYGETITDRMKDMYNVILLTGDSFRS